QAHVDHLPDVIVAGAHHQHLALAWEDKGEVLVQHVHRALVGQVQPERLEWHRSNEFSNLISGHRHASIVPGTYPGANGHRVKQAEFPVTRGHA
ncbi:MAG: hypothetical protein ACKPEA_02320, partial [Planctomycetota bacterium]